MNTKNTQSIDEDIKNPLHKRTYNNDDILVKNEILGVGITNASIKSILEYIVRSMEKNTKKYYITTPNPEILVYANKNPEYKNILNKSQIALCDGVGLVYAGIILGKPFKERITGVDFVRELCKAIARKPITVGFLGGRQGVAELTAHCLQKEFPTLEVNFIGEEWDDKQPHKSIDILFVAFGFPKQEIWMSEYANKLSVHLMIGVGGAFNFISKRISRAPLWVRKLGFEWIYRLIQEPWRWRRQIALIQYIFLVLREKFSKS